LISVNANELCNSRGSAFEHDFDFSRFGKRFKSIASGFLILCISGDAQKEKYRSDDDQFRNVFHISIAGKIVFCLQKYTGD
jgi:hypothetical protein